jgi:hypothetical protein
MRVRGFEIPAAAALMIHGTYPALPSSIQYPTVGAPPSIILPRDLVIDQLDRLIRRRLLFNPAPPYISRVDVIEGALFVEVQNEFEAILTLDRVGETAPWVIISVSVFISASGESSAAGFDSEGDEFGAGWTNFGACTDVRTGGAAKLARRALSLSPTPTQLIYLRKIIQRALSASAAAETKEGTTFKRVDGVVRSGTGDFGVDSKSPSASLAGLYNIAHAFCTGLSLQILHAQVPHIKF